MISRKFYLAFYAIVDLLSILPYYLELILSGRHLGELQRFTVLRLFRLIRLARCYHYSSLLQVSIDAMLVAVAKSADALLAIVVFLSLVVVVFSTLIYFAERGTWDPNQRQWIDIDGHPSQFESIPATFWFVLEILTTVGLGDIVPRTVAGKIITFPLMLLGLLLIALPSIVVGRHFAEAWPVIRERKQTTLLISKRRHQSEFISVKPRGDHQSLRDRLQGEDQLQTLIAQIVRQNELLEKLLRVNS